MIKIGVFMPLKKYLQFSFSMPIDVFSTPIPPHTSTYVLGKTLNKKFHRPAKALSKLSPPIKKATLK
jgi:hypothetical protein